jgi:ribosomal protein S12 methylthiotransferase
LTPPRKCPVFARNKTRNLRDGTLARATLRRTSKTQVDPAASPPKPKVALITYGCAKNLVDSEVMSGLLDRAGHEFVADPSRADVIILNTCGFIAPAREEAEDAIRRALAAKRRRPKTRVVVAGCYGERYGPDLARRYPDIDTITGVKDFDRIVEIARGESFRASRRTFLYDHATPRNLSTPASWAYVKISEGCSHRCAFCSIPLIKGPYRSRSASSIVEEARRLASRGVREINLVSQDTTYFGRDKGRANGLAALLDRLVGVGELSWIRLLYGYPDEVSAALLEAMRHPKVCPYLDIPFQHADRPLLRRMNRPMEAGRALRLLDRLREKIPEVAVRTSLIVGLPGEGRAEFERLKSFVKKARFDHLGVFTYSREEGTTAFPLGDPVRQRIKDGRRNEIMALQTEISAAKLRSYVGQTLDVILEGPAAAPSDAIVGRTRFQAPEVDGVVVIEAPRPVPAGPPVRKVEITSSDIYDLRGRLRL